MGGYDHRDRDALIAGAREDGLRPAAQSNCYKHVPRINQLFLSYV